jgi:hypothetical protein
VESKTADKIKQTPTSYWTKERSEAFGLFYEKGTSTISDFYDLFGSCNGKNRYGFVHPLDGEERSLLDCLVDQTNELIGKHGVEMGTDWDWVVTADWPHVYTNCRDTVRNLTQNLNTTCNPTSG